MIIKATATAYGNVIGPALAVDNEVPRFDGTTGKIIQAGTGVIIDDAGQMYVPGISLLTTIDMPEISTPAAPDTDKIRIYAVEDADFTVLETITNLGVINRINQDTFRVARNTSGGALAKGTVVYYSGSTENKPNFAAAKADAIGTMPAVGILGAAVSNNNFGEVMVVGRLTGIKTNYTFAGEPTYAPVADWAEGDVLYVNDTVLGALQNSKPTHPSFSQWIATIEVVHATQGIILVKTQAILGLEDGTNSNSFTIGDTATGTKSLKFDGLNDSTLQWDSANSLWSFTSGKVGIGETAPETLMELSSTAPYITLHNTTEEDTDYGRESRIIFKGEQSGSVESTLGVIEIAHDGTGANQRGIYTLKLNRVLDGDAPASILTVNSSEHMGIGTTTPQCSVHAVYTSIVQPRGLCSDNYTDSIGSGTVLLRHARGSVESPSALTQNDSIGNISFSGHDGTGFQAHQALIQAWAAENFVYDTNYGSYLTIQLIENNTGYDLYEAARFTDAGDFYLNVGNMYMPQGFLSLINSSANVETTGARIENRGGGEGTAIALEFSSYTDGTIVDKIVSVSTPTGFDLAFSTWGASLAEALRIFGSGGNVAIGSTTLPASMTKGLILSTGTAPSGNVTNQCSVYSADQTAGNSCLHTRSEAGQIVKLYSEAHIIDADGTLADITTKFNTLLSQLESQGLLLTA